MNCFIHREDSWAIHSTSSDQICQRSGGKCCGARERGESTLCNVGDLEGCPRTTLIAPYPHQYNVWCSAGHRSVECFEKDRSRRHSHGANRPLRFVEHAHFEK